MSKKKVLFTSHTANFQKFNRPFMRMLREQGWEVHYASMGEEKILDADKVFVVSFTRSPCKLSNIHAYKQLKEIIEREKYDIIHTHTPMGSVVTRMAARNTRKRGTLVLYTAHGFHFFDGAPLLNWLVYYPVEKYMARHTDGLITINDEDYQRAKRNFKTKAYYLPGVGVDASRFKPATKMTKRQLRKEYGFREKDFILIYAAELNANKNQRFLIKQMPALLNKISHAKLLLCGEGELQGKYERLIKKLGLEESTHLMGYRQDLAKLFQISDVCVASSIREGLGLNLVEAIVSGVPVVASYNRGHSSVVRHGVNGYCYPLGSASEYLGAVCEIYRHPKKIKVPTMLEKRYSVEDILQQMQRVYLQTPVGKKDRNR